MGDSGRKLVDTTRAIAAPEADPTLATDGHPIQLQGRMGSVSPEYLDVVFDLVGGTSITVDIWLYHGDVQNVEAWQKIGTRIVSDDTAVAPTRFVVPTLGAVRVALIVQSEVGGVTDASYTVRAIDEKDAQALVEISTAAGAASDVNVTEVSGNAVHDPVAGVQGVSVSHLGASAISQAAGVQDVAVTSAPETDVNLTKVVGVAASSPVAGVQGVSVSHLGADAVSQAAGVQNVAVTSAPETEMDLTKAAGVVLAAVASGVLPVSFVPRAVDGPTSIIDDGAADTTPITTAYADNVSAWTDLEDSCSTLAVRLNTDVTTPTSVELEIMWHEAAAVSAADATAFYMPLVNTAAGGQEQLADRETSWVGRAGVALENGSHYCEYARPATAASYKVRIKRTGGDALTEAQVTVAQVG